MYVEFSMDYDVMIVMIIAIAIVAIVKRKKN